MALITAAELTEYRRRMTEGPYRLSGDVSAHQSRLPGALFMYGQMENLPVGLGRLMRSGGDWVTGAQYVRSGGAWVEVT